MCAFENPRLLRYQAARTQGWLLLNRTVSHHFIQPKLQTPTVLFNIHIPLLQLQFLVLISLWFPVSRWWQLTLFLCVFQFHYYYNPNFRRHFLHLLVKCKQSFDPKNPPANTKLSLDPALHAHHRKRKPDVELARETTSEEESGPFTAAPRENMHISAPRKTAPAKRRAEERPKSDVPLHLQAPRQQ